MTIHRILAKLFLASLLVCSGIAAQAQSLGLTPAMIDAKVRRGATYTVDFTLHNGSNTRVRARCSVSDYWYGEDNRRVTARPGTLPRSASLWTQFTPAEVLIEPQGSATVRAVITIPRTASGSYYTAPTFETEAADDLAPVPQPPGTTRANIKVRFQGLLLLTTEDGAEYNVEVLGGKVVPPSSSSPLEMELDVRNRGTAHARLRGVFALLDETGRLAGRGKVEEKRYLPGQRDDFRAFWAGELAPGRYTAVVTLTYDRAGMEPATLVYELPFEARKQ